MEFNEMINRVIQGNVIDVLRQMPPESVDCVVTSPPYWGLRDYGTATWEGGDVNCEHKRTNKSQNANTGQANSEAISGDGIYKEICGLCGAKRIDNQIGLEKTPEEYMAKIVEIFGEIKRILKKEGTCWLNLGDSYAGSCGNGSVAQSVGQAKFVKFNSPTSKIENLKPKDLVGIPWQVAFALQADGWWLRQDIIWSKPNPMPESVTDRCTKSHEYVFLLTKNSKYYFDSEAIREGNNYCIKKISKKSFGGDGLPQNMNKAARMNRPPIETFGRNKRSVWTITTKSFKEAHFATFPEDLIKPMILAGCPKDGLVLDCFGGSGTTGVVAKKLGRNFILIDLNEKYCKIAERRINAVPERLNKFLK